MLKAATTYRSSFHFHVFQHITELLERFHCYLQTASYLYVSSHVKRGQNAKVKVEDEAKPLRTRSEPRGQGWGRGEVFKAKAKFTTWPRPSSRSKLRGRGQNHEAEAEVEAKSSRPRPKLWGQGQNHEAEAEVKVKSSRPRPRSRPDTNENTWQQCQECIHELVSHTRVLNHVFVMNVAMIQPQNGYNQYYCALDSTFF